MLYQRQHALFVLTSMQLLNHNDATNFHTTTVPMQKSESKIYAGTPPTPGHMPLKTNLAHATGLAPQPLCVFYCFV